MNVEYINPLIASMSSVFVQITGKNIKRKKMYINGNNKDYSKGLKRVAIMIEITGDLKGQLSISLNENTSLSVASNMMMGMPVSELDDMSKSAISEMGNMIAGNYATSLSGIDLRVDISPPSLSTGENIEIMINNGNQLSIVFDSELGDIIVDICVNDTELS